jgi:ABC-2 type transport system permease protein
MTMLRYLDLYLTYFRFTLKAWSQYRADFIISVISSIVLDGSTLLFLTVVFTNIQQLEGWTFPEMVLIWGLSLITRFLANGILDAPHRIYWYIRYGTLDRLLVRPAEPMFQIAAESGINLPALGRVMVGVAAVLVVLPGLGLPWWSAFYLPLVIFTGVLIMFSVQWIAACLCFWFTNSVSVLTTMAWMVQFGQYPATIFSLPLRFLFTWVIPYAMMAFYPVAFLLRGGEYRIYGLLAPSVGIAFFGMGAAVWRVALRRYQSTGS